MDYFSIVACALFLAIMLCLIGLMLSRPITRQRQKRRTHQTAVEAASAIVRHLHGADNGNERDLCMATISSDGEARPPHTIQEPEDSEQFLKELRAHAWDRGVSYTPEQQIALWHVWQCAEERRRKAEAEREAAE